MSSTKKRKEFNAAWRKARKILRRAQTKKDWTPENVQLAARYRIDVLAGESVR
jgi:hypothetical protein